MSDQTLIAPAEFADKILTFYQQQGRKDLPWQQNPTAYRVWVSEIMLQQTQVKTVIPYYLKFMARFKTLKQLAESDLDEVLHHWQGLGYYSRARNLHKCAQQVVEQYNGEFPQDVTAMESLPGIGRSTAGAVLSLAYGKPTPILDGNVKRVLARAFMVEGWSGHSATAKVLWKLTENYTPQHNTGQFNQAMMDLGAGLCSRSKPQCEVCPLTHDCLANRHGMTSQYPFKKPSKVIPTRQGLMLLKVNDQGQVMLEKRPPSGIWGGLWSLPELSLESPRDLQESSLIDEFRHTFSHFHFEVKVVDAQLPQQVAENPSLNWHNIGKLNELAFPAPIKKFLFSHFQLNE